MKVDGIEIFVVKGVKELQVVRTSIIYAIQVPDATRVIFLINLLSICMFTTISISLNLD